MRTISQNNPHYSSATHHGSLLCKPLLATITTVEDILGLLLCLALYKWFHLGKTGLSCAFMPGGTGLVKQQTNTTRLVSLGLNLFSLSNAMQGCWVTSQSRTHESSQTAQV